jgi:hypothetical protein
MAAGAIASADAAPREIPAAAYRDEVKPAAPVLGLESLAIFLLFGAAYFLLGSQLVGNQHLVSFDALDRLSRAYMSWYNDPAKLAAIGFDIPPIDTLTIMPLAVFKPLATSGLAMPLHSAIFAAGSLTFIDRMLAAGDLTRVVRWVVLLLVAINPMFMFYATNGASDMTYIFFASFALFCFVAWGRSGSARYIIGGGLAIALAALTHYEFIIWAVFLGFVVAAALSSEGREDMEIQGTVIAYLAPLFYALGIWILFNAAVIGDPFGWISQAGDPVNAALTPTPPFDLGEAIRNVFRVELIFPLTLVMFPLLLLSGTPRAISIGIAGLIAINIGFLIGRGAIDDTVGAIELHDALPAMIACLAGVAWLHYSAEDLRGIIVALAIIGGVIALPLAWEQMRSFPHQNLEQSFTRALFTGDDQEGTSSRGGFTVGIAPEREMANFIDELDPGTRDVLTDNARTFGVIQITGKPEVFFDRVDQGDAEWQEVLEQPFGSVDFMLVDSAGSGRIQDQYPGAADGEIPGLEVVANNDRYTLLRVTGEPIAPPAEEPAP